MWVLSVAGVHSGQSATRTTVYIIRCYIPFKIDRPRHAWYWNTWNMSALQHISTCIPLLQSYVLSSWPTVRAARGNSIGMLAALFRPVPINISNFTLPTILPSTMCPRTSISRQTLIALPKRWWQRRPPLFPLQVGHHYFHWLDGYICSECMYSYSVLNGAGSPATPVFAAPFAFVGVAAGGMLAF